MIVDLIHRHWREWNNWVIRIPRYSKAPPLRVCFCIFEEGITWIYAFRSFGLSAQIFEVRFKKIKMVKNKTKRRGEVPKNGWCILLWRFPIFLFQVFGVLYRWWGLLMWYQDYRYCFHSYPWWVKKWWFPRFHFIEMVLIFNQLIIASYQLP